MSNLYVNAFQLFPLYVTKIEEISSTNNWLIFAESRSLGMTYSFYFGKNTTNDKLVGKLKDGIEIVVYGTIKSNKSNQIVLRAKQIIVSE